MIKTIKLVLIFVCISLWGYVAWRMDFPQFLAGHTPMLDFDTYYQTAIDVRHGLHPFSLPYMQTGGPPSVIIPYLPFSLLSLPLARSVMNICNIGAILITGWLLASYWGKENHWLKTIMISTGLLVPFPTRFNLGQGQPNLWIMAAVAYLLTSQQKKISSIALSLIILIKTNYSLMLLSFWNTKKVLLKTIGLLIVFLAIASPVIKPQYYIDFIQLRLFQTTFSSANNNDADYYNQSLKATLNRLAVPNMYPFLFITIFIIVLVYLIKHPYDRASGVLFSLLLSPVLWQHYVVVSYPIAFLCLIHKSVSWQVKTLTLFGLCLVSIEIPLLHHQSLQFPRQLLASHYFFGLCCLFIAQYKNQSSTN